MDTTNKFLNGLMVKAPKQGAPSFVKGSISIKRLELIGTLTAMEGEWINLDIKESKDGSKWYAQINEWKPKVGDKVEAHGSDDF
jgi:hypothetical protein